jgi:galactokinase
MGDRGYEHRKKWNSENYKQLNVALRAELADAFKSACEANGEPARQAVIRLITEYLSNAQPKKRTTANLDYSTRAKRKKAAMEMLGQLEAMRDAEEEYRDKIPENMYNKQEEAERTVGIYEDAISAVEELYSI